MLTGHSYALLKSPAPSKEMERKLALIGALVTGSAAPSAMVFSPPLQQFGIDSRDDQASAMARGGRSKHFTRPFACGRVQVTLKTTDLARRVKTITSGARVN